MLESNPLPNRLRKAKRTPPSKDYPRDEARMSLGGFFVFGYTGLARRL